MNKSKLIQTLCVFSPQSKTKLLQFIRSPYWNDDKPVDDVLALTRYVFNCMEQGNEAGLEKKQAELFLANELQKKVQLNKLMSKALNLFVKPFIVQESVDRAMTDEAILIELYHFYTKNNIYAAAQLKHDKLEIWQKGSRSHWNYKDFLNSIEFSLRKIYYNSMNTQGKDDLGVNSFLDELSHVFLHLHLYYKNALLATNNKTPLLSEEQLLDISPYPKFNDAYFASDYGSLQLAAYQLLHPTIKTKIGDYHYFKKTLSAVFNDLPINDLRNYVVFARHYLVEQYDKDDKVLLQELFDLYTWQFDENNRLYNHEIPIGTFYAACIMALRLGNVEWAEEMVEKHKGNILELLHKDEALAVCKARILFFKKEYEKSLDTLILPQNSTETQLKYLIRTTHVQVLYELDSRLLDYEIENTRQFFNRERKENEVHFIGERNRNFIYTVKRFQNTSFGISRKFTEKIKQDIVRYESIAEREWLLKIVGEALVSCKDD